MGDKEKYLVKTQLDILLRKHMRQFTEEVAVERGFMCWENVSKRRIKEENAVGERERMDRDLKTQEFPKGTINLYLS